MSIKMKVAVAALIAALSVGGLAPAASARRTVAEQMGIAAERMKTGVNRIERNVGREVYDVTQFVERDVEREVLGLGLFLERTLNPR